MSIYDINCKGGTLNRSKGSGMEGGGGLPTAQPHPYIFGKLGDGRGGGGWRKYGLGTTPHILSMMNQFQSKYM